MFRWASPQPLPATLTHLLAQAGGCRCGPHEAPELTVFLPPHLVLTTGAGRRGDLGAAYAGADAAGSSGLLVNGERLLGLQPGEIAHWLLGRPLQRPLELAAVDPLLAAVTLAQLEQRPELVERYQRLDARSERGGSAAEQDYRQRLRPCPTALLAAWNDLGAHRISQDARALQRARQQLQELTDELESEVIAAHRARELATHRLRTNQLWQSELERMRRLLFRLMALQGRLFAAAPTRIRP